MPTEHAPYKCMDSSSLSDLKKSTVVDDSLSKTSTRCSVPENTNQLQDCINRMRNLHQMMSFMGMDVSHSVYLHLAKVILSKQSLNFRDKTSFCQFLTRLLPV